jgi:hypothetical protein
MSNERGGIRMSDRVPYKRTKLLINPGFQLSFMAYTAGIAVFVAAVFYGAIFHFFWKFRQLGESAGLRTDHVFYKFIAEQQTALNWGFAVVCAVVVVSLCLHGLLLSHRVAGPLYRLRKHLELVSEGKGHGNVKFRDKDYFPELADACNRAFEATTKNKAA